MLDRFIEQYRVTMGSYVSLQNNVFDYEVHFEINDIVLYNFSDEQRRVKNFRECKVHLMCKDEEHGSLDFALESNAPPLLILKVVLFLGQPFKFYWI